MPAANIHLSDADSRACSSAQTAQMPKATAPFQASAENPVALRLIRIALSAAMKAMARPHRRQTQYMPRMIPTCWSSPNHRSVASETPNTL